MNSFCAVPRKQNVAIFNQAFDFPALSLHKTERRGQDTLQRKLLMRITSLVTSPLIRSSCFSSRDHAKLKIRSEAKFVIWRGGPPDRGCSQRLEAPFLVSPYCRALPEGDQARPRVPRGTWLMKCMGPPAVATMAIFGMGTGRPSW